MGAIRDLLRNIIFFVFGLIIFILALRFLFDIVGISDSLGWFVSFSDTFIDPFRNIVGRLDFGTRTLDLTVLFSIFSYLMLATLLEQLLLAFFYEDLRIIFIEIVVSVFKLIEYLVLYRIVIRLGDMDGISSLKSDIYRWSDIFVSPLNFIPSLRVGAFEIDFAAITILVLVVILDILIEIFLTQFLFPTVKYESRRVFYRVKTKPAM